MVNQMESGQSAARRRTKDRSWTGNRRRSKGNNAIDGEQAAEVERRRTGKQIFLFPFFWTKFSFSFNLRQKPAATVGPATIAKQIESMGSQKWIERIKRNSLSSSSNSRTSINRGKMVEANNSIK